MIRLLLDTRKLVRAADGVEWTAEPLAEDRGYMTTRVLPPSTVEKAKTGPQIHVH
jgi:hypothetical protein